MTPESERLLVWTVAVVWSLAVWAGAVLGVLALVRHFRR